MDLKKRVLADYQDDSLSISELASKHGVSRYMVEKWSNEENLSRKRGQRVKDNALGPGHYYHDSMGIHRFCPREQVQAALDRVLELCDTWDTLSKGTTSSTRQIRSAIDGEPNA